jgi:hypothetical protein
MIRVRSPSRRTRHGIWLRSVAPHAVVRSFNVAGDGQEAVAHVKTP